MMPISRSGLNIPRRLLRNAKGIMTWAHLVSSTSYVRETKVAGNTMRNKKMNRSKNGPFRFTGVPVEEATENVYRAMSKRSDEETNPMDFYQGFARSASQL